jgi:hypothetical protein
MLHAVTIETSNPHARVMLATWAGHMARAAWDVDPETGRQYEARFDAFVLRPSGVDPVPLDVTSRPGAVPPGVAAYLDSLAGLLADAAADARCGLTDPAALMESVAADLARLAQAPAPTARQIRQVAP